MTHPKDIPTLKGLKDLMKKVEEKALDVNNTLRKLHGELETKTARLISPPNFQSLPWLKPNMVADDLRDLTNKLAACRTSLPEVTQKDLVAENWNPVMDQIPLWCPEKIAKMSASEAFKAGQDLGDYVMAKKDLEEGKMSPNEFRKIAERLSIPTTKEPTTGGCSTEDTTTNEDDPREFQKLDRVAYKPHKDAEWEYGTVREIRGENLMVVWDDDVRRRRAAGLLEEETMAKSIGKWQTVHSHEAFDEPIDEEQFDPDLKMDW